MYEHRESFEAVVNCQCLFVSFFLLFPPSSDMLCVVHYMPRLFMYTSYSTISPRGSDLTMQGEYVLRVDPPEGWSFSKHTPLPLVSVWYNVHCTSLMRAHIWYIRTE